MARPSLQACRCCAEIGAARPRRRFSRVPRSLNPAPRNGPSSRSAIQWCHARSTSETSSAEPCRASSNPEKIAYSVSSVPAGSSLTNPSIRPQRRRISEGRRFSAGAPSASPTASPSSAPLARSRRAAVLPVVPGCAAVPPPPSRACAALSPPASPFTASPFTTPSFRSSGGRGPGPRAVSASGAGAVSGPCPHLCHAVGGERRKTCGKGPVG